MNILKWMSAVTALTVSFLSPVQIYAADVMPFEYEKDTWAFSNSGFYFHDAYQDNLLPEHLEALKEKLNHVEYRLIENALKTNEFQGMCYGFAVTSMLGSQNIFIPRDHAEEYGVYSFELTENVSSIRRFRLVTPKVKTFYEQSLIAYYMLLQSTDAVRQDSIKVCNWTIQKKLEYLIEHGKQNHPVLVCYNGLMNDEYYGHAVVAYGLEDGSWEWDGKEYDTRIMIYDPNVEKLDWGRSSEEVQEAINKSYEASHIYYNSETHDWIIPMIQLMYKDMELDLVGLFDDVNILNEKGLLDGTNYVPQQWKDVITTNALQSAHSVTVKDTGNALSEYPAFYMDISEDSRLNFVHDGEEAAYEITLDDVQELHSSVYYQNCLLIVNGESCNQVSFEPNGAVTVNGEKADYSLEVVTNKNYPTQWYDVTVSGTSRTATLSLQENGYVLKADDLDSVTVTVENHNDIQKKTYSTDSGSILFFENESGELSASVDLDQNGTFETILKDTCLLGDVNQDGIVNASDATAVLIAAANIGVGKALDSFSFQLYAADVNRDTKINSQDATWILRYSAAFGTGNAPDTIEEFLTR